MVNYESSVHRPCLHFTSIRPPEHVSENDLTKMKDDLMVNYEC